MTKIFFSTLFLLFAITSVGQYTICDCCSSSLTYKNDKEDSLFNPDFIRQYGIHELTIRTTSKKMVIKGKDTTFNVVDKEYNEYIFKFNNAGYIDKKIWFNRLGQFHSMYEYTRDANNRVTKIVFHYLDSLGNIPKDYDLPETTDYTYTNGLLTKTKKRDFDQKIQPDEKSIYQQYEYDSRSRVKKVHSYSYYDNGSKPFIFTSFIKYNDTTNISISKTYDNKKLFTTKKINLDKSGRIISSYFYDKVNKLLQQEKYFYNDYGQLIKASTKSFPGMGTECPDGGNFTNMYSYNKFGLLDSIRHQYKTTECTMRFIYK